MKKRVQAYVHRSKESNWPLAEKLGFEENSEAERCFNYMGYEIPILFEVDTETGEAKVIGADGKFLGDEKYTCGDVEVSE